MRASYGWMKENNDSRSGFGVWHKGLRMAVLRNI